MLMLSAKVLKRNGNLSAAASRVEEFSQQQYEPPGLQASDDEEPLAEDEQKPSTKAKRARSPECPAACRPPPGY